MSWVAVAIGGAAVVGGAVSYFGAQDAAHAAKNAALEQQDQANANAAASRHMSGTMIDNASQFADASPQELNILSKNYEAASRGVEQQQKLMASIDPALMEASKQALSILRGGAAASQAPIMAMRNQQRNSLVQSLRAQYGPGAEMSSVGQRALQQFDLQSNVLQQQTLGNLMGIATNPNVQGNMNQALSGLNSVGQGYAAIQTRKANTQLGLGSTALGALQQANNGLLQTAGAGQTGAALAGQGQAALGNSIGNAGMTLGMMYGMKQQPTTTTPQSSWGGADSNQLSAGTMG